LSRCCCFCCLVYGMVYSQAEDVMARIMKGFIRCGKVRLPDAYIPLSVLEKQFDVKFKYVSSSENIVQQMIDAGSGARGIVFGSYGPGLPGHVFNVVNQNGTIRFLDGQTGKSAVLGQFKSFQLLRTN
uniref:toxin glutamine deamidase domain-containing protein n=1 Tax=Serratia microhaemolytica TaxID=2675110 RepID=UPI001F0CC2D0